MAALPLVVGSAPFGLLCGGMARQSGLGLTETLALSGLVNAGSAQLIGIGMLSAGTAWPLVVATVLVVNARHLFYSADLSPRFAHLPTRWRAALAFGMTDAVYAVAAGRYRQRGTGRSDRAHWYVVTVSATVYATWLTSTLAGWVWGESLHHLDGLGLEFAVVATYIGLVVPCFTSPRPLVTGLLAGALALALRPLPYQGGLLVATLLAVTAATFGQSRTGPGPRGRTAPGTARP
ncbi:AzlC family ABC transporter permease [Streptomyces smyrnaeus]|uniref:AzlC family ABC transporter permease n=1 Tax=Streptomyces smyrnaeus TaxID=1387713 RepID=A0ABS3Y128_9ACTN|nr:AzlC family ABC transporter permease [Streptomyces smyrnaeus]MBO8201371.1 AzlC family ABC transporter permease [Streptomyces smyrnaeus]